MIYALMRRRLVSTISQTIREISMKLGMSKVSAPVSRIFFTAVPVIMYQRAILASVFPTWFLVHASLINEKRKETVQNNKKLTEQADALYEEMKYEEIYGLLHPYELTNDDDILWRLARATYELSLQSSSKERAKSLGEEALQYIKKAIEINDNNHNAHRWYAIVLDHVADMNGIKERLIKSKECREHMEKAITICSTDATSHYMIGVWCYSFADLPWYLRKMATIVFTSPPESSFEEALVYFEKAEELQPNFYSKNLLMMAKTYLKLNDKEKAISFLRKTKNYPLKTKDDHEAFKEADNLLKSLKVK